MSNKARPPRYKLAVVTWAGAYAVITLILWLLGPSMASWPLPVRTLAISVLMVITLTWVVIPALTRLFRPWLAGHVGRYLGFRAQRFPAEAGRGASLAELRAMARHNAGQALGEEWAVRVERRTAGLERFEPCADLKIRVEIALGRAARTKGELRVRQPLAKLLFYAPQGGGASVGVGARPGDLLAGVWLLVRRDARDASDASDLLFQHRRSCRW